MDVNDHKIQNIGVRKCIYLYNFVKLVFIQTSNSLEIITGFRIDFLICRKIINFLKKINNNNLL